MDENEASLQDEFNSETPAYIDMNSNDVVEVEIDETQDLEPMEDDDNNNDGNDNIDMDMETDKAAAAAPPDHSFCCIDSHSDSVYTVALDVQKIPSMDNFMVHVASGGGDDKAFLHAISTSSQQHSEQQQQVNYKTNSNPNTVLNLSEAAPAQSHKDTVSCVAFNTNTLIPGQPNAQKMLAIGSYDGSIQLWKIATSTSTSTSSTSIPEQYEFHSTLEGPTDIEWLSWHPKGGTVLLAGSTDGTVWMYHALTSKCLQVFVGHEGDVTSGTFTLDGKFAVTAGLDGSVRVWAPRTGLSRHVFRFEDLVDQTGSNGNSASAGMYDNGTSPGATITCMSCRLIPNNNGGNTSLILCGGENGLAHVCHVGTKKVLTTLRHAEEQSNQQSNQQQQQQQHQNAMDADSTNDEEFHHQDTRSVEAVGFFSGPNHTDSYNWCATAGVNGLLKIWDLGNNSQCRQICPHPNHTNDDNNNEGGGASTQTTASTGTMAGITRLKWHPTLPLIFTATTDGVVRLWDARTGQCLLTLTGGHSEIINDLDVYFDNEDTNQVVVATASDDGKLHLFRVDIRSVLQVHS